MRYIQIHILPLSFKEYLNSVNDIWMETINHSDYPYTKISEEFGLKPEFFYAYNNLDAEKIEIDEEHINIRDLEKEIIKINSLLVRNL